MKRRTIADVERILDERLIEARELLGKHETMIQEFGRDVRLLEELQQEIAALGAEDNAARISQT